VARVCRRERLLPKRHLAKLAANDALHAVILPVPRAVRLLNDAITEKVFYFVLANRAAKKDLRIARAVVAGPKLILADEPTGNLDSKNGKEVMDLLKELHSEGTTIVMVTHSQKDAAQAQRTIDLFDGQIVSDVKNEL